MQQGSSSSSGSGSPYHEEDAGKETRKSDNDNYLLLDYDSDDELLEESVEGRLSYRSFRSNYFVRLFRHGNFSAAEAKDKTST
jgi:hypothetical protein